MSCQRGKWPKKMAKQKGGYSGSTKRANNSSFCNIDGHLSFQKCGVGTKVSKVQRPGRAPRWHCQRRLRFFRCIHRTVLVCVVSDGRKSNRRHSKATRMCRTSSWCSICSHSGQNGRCSEIAQNLKGRTSIHMDPSSTTQMANVIVKHWRPGCSSWTKSVQSPTCSPLVGKTVRGRSIGTWMAKST